MSDSSLPHVSRPDPDDVRRDATEDAETSASSPDAAGEPQKPPGAEANAREREPEANGSELDRSEPASPPSDAENLEPPSDEALPAEGSGTTAPSAAGEDPAADQDPAADENGAAASAPLDDRIAEAPPQTTCANCDAPLVGPYCAQCGQRAAERIVPLHEMTREWVEDLFEFDIRIFRTLPTFFFKPGRLTDEYVRGRRVRYVRPLRLYLVSSFILFSLLAFSDVATIETEDRAAPTDATEATLTPAQIDSLVDVQIDEASSSADPSVLVPAIQQAITSQAAVTSISDRTVTLDTTLLRQQLQSLDTLGRASTAAIDSFARSAVDRADARVPSPSMEDADPGIPDPEDPALPPQSERSQMAEEVANSLDINLGFEDPETEARAKEFLRSRIVRVIEDPNAFLRGMIDRAPIFMFLLLPLFAFLLKLLYIRRGKLYVQHLIFALHVHALFFLVFSVVTGLLLTEISALHTAAGWLSFTPFAYLYIAMQHVYKQGWIKTGMKLVLLMFTYNTFLFVGVGLLALANFLLMG